MFQKKLQQNFYYHIKHKKPQQKINFQKQLHMNKI